MSGRTLTFCATLLAIVLLGLAVGAASYVQRRAGEGAVDQTRSAQSLLMSIYEMDIALRGFTLSGDALRLPAYAQAGEAAERTVVAARRASAGEPAALAAVETQARAVADWRRSADRRVRAVQANPAAIGRIDVREAERRRATLDRFRSANLRYTAAIDRRFRRDEARASALVIVVALGLGGIFALSGWITVRRVARQTAARRDAERTFEARQRDLNLGLQVTESEEEAQGFLHRHLQRTIPESEVVVLKRNNSANRLAPGTPLAAGSALEGAFEDADPRSCLAIRLASRRTQSGPADDSVLECGICGRMETQTSCSPLLVGGEVIGSVLVSHRQALTDTDERAIDESVKQAAPVLANLRNLAIAETRAATDGLTGLPNRRAFEESLRRMVAQANRLMSPLAAVALDLDHFKQINDVHGHGRGDEVLAEVGALLSTMVRESDFVARVGGEEFMILLPDTGRDGALIICERIRSAIAALEFPTLGRDVTASLGIAIMPDDEADGPSLVRAADRMLYTAKANGRDRVEISELDLGVLPDGEVAAP